MRKQYKKAEPEVFESDSSDSGSDDDYKKSLGLTFKNSV